MRVAIVGAGAMGSLFGFLLFGAGKDVWLLDKHPELTQRIRDRGLRVEGASGEHIAPVPITTAVHDIQRADLIIVFVKAYDTAQAIEDAKALVRENSVVLTLQNGIGNVEAIVNVVGERKTIAGTTAHGATVLGPGHIRHAGTGETILGELHGEQSKRLVALKKFLGSAGISVTITQDVASLLWSKLLINIGINPLTGITDVPNGALLDFDETRAVMHRAVDEAKQIALRKGIRLMYEDHLQKVDSVCQATAGNISSMLQDLRNRKKTEIDFINGALVKEGGGEGVTVPINQALTHLIHLRERC